MDSDKVKDDIALAQRICKELRSGNRKALHELIDLYSRPFYRFAWARLYDSQLAEDVLQNFWLELMNGKAICNYSAKDNATLRTYLYNILNYRIIDQNRKILRNLGKVSQNLKNDSVSNSAEDINSTVEREETKIQSSDSTPESMVETEKKVESFSSINIKSYDERAEKLSITPWKTRLDLEGDLIEDERLRVIGEVVHETIELLSQISARDARYIQMYYFEGLTYREIAERELGDKKNDEKEILKKINAVKQQVTRKRYGSLAKFTILLKRIMNSKGLKYKDFL